MAGRPDLVARRQVFDLLRRGRNGMQAAAESGVSKTAVYRWRAEIGGVIPRDVVYSSRFLDRDERYEIARLVGGGAGVRAVARAVGRDPATVSRELRRNRHPRTGRYEPERANTLAHARQRRPKARKLSVDERLRGWVQERLDVQDSPEQIAGRLPVDFPDDARMRISHESIYQAIYVHAAGQLRREVRRQLRTARTARKPRSTRTPQTGRGRIPDALSIAERPEAVAGRLVPGHHEGDLIMGGTGTHSAIATIVERSSGYLTLVHLPDGYGAEQVATAIAAQVTQLPELLRQTLTWDRGMEMAEHKRLAAETGMRIYFADPYSPWQRGTNENTNGLLRQYFPKGTDLSRWSAEDLQAVAVTLNGRPRKTLGWKTPAEALDELLASIQQAGVASTG